MKKKIFKTKYLLFTLIILVTVSTPFFVQAHGLVPCGGEGEPFCNVCFLFKLLENVMNFLVNTVGVIATLFLVVGGVVLVVSGANKGLYETGKKIITNTIIGTAIVLMAWIGINTILTIAGFTRANIGLSGNWFELQCSTVAGTTAGGAATPAPSGGATQSPGGAVSVPTQGETPSSCDSPCNRARGGWTPADCNATIDAAASSQGVEKALLKAIMWQENGRNSGEVTLTKVSPHGACGPMQLLPSTAVSISAAFGTCDALKTRGSVAIAAQYIKDTLIPSVDNNNLSSRYNMDRIELIAAGYNGGPGASTTLSADCGKNSNGTDKNCNSQPNAGFPGLVPRWRCPYDFTGGVCVANTGFAETRSYTVNVKNAYNFYKSCSN